MKKGSSFYNYLKLLRYHQWIKNLILFFPIFFGEDIFNIKRLVYTILGFISFCMLSSSGYIINDIKDIKKDRQHNKKRVRPLAAGQIDIKSAYLAAIFLFAVSMALGLVINIPFIAVMLLYFTNVNLYTFFVKKLAYIDILSIALGFIFRLYAGSEASGIHLSYWLISLTLLVAVMLGAGKRYEELASGNKASRDNLNKYNPKTVQIIIIFAGIMSTTLFGLYLSPHNVYDFSLLFVSGILLFNYLYNVLANKIGEPTDFFMQNRINFFLLIIWTLLFFKRMYF